MYHQVRALVQLCPRTASCDTALVALVLRQDEQDGHVALPTAAAAVAVVAAEVAVVQEKLLVLMAVHKRTAVAAPKLRCLMGESVAVTVM